MLPVVGRFRFALIFMIEINPFNIKGFRQGTSIFYPHSCAIKVNEHPLVQIEINRVSVLGALFYVCVFRQAKGSPSISCVDVHPHVKLLAYRSNLLQVIKRTSSSRSNCQ